MIKGWKGVRYFHILAQKSVTHKKDGIENITICVTSFREYPDWTDNFLLITFQSITLRRLFYKFLSASHLSISENNLPCKPFISSLVFQLQSVAYLSWFWVQDTFLLIKHPALKKLLFQKWLKWPRNPGRLTFRRFNSNP